MLGLVKSGKIHTIGPTAGQGDPRTSGLQAMDLVVLSKDSQSNKNTNRSYRAMNWDIEIWNIEASCEETVVQLTPRFNILIIVIMIFLIFRYTAAMYSRKS